MGEVKVLVEGGIWVTIILGRWVALPSSAERRILIRLRQSVDISAPLASLPTRIIVSARTAGAGGGHVVKVKGVSVGITQINRRLSCKAVNLRGAVGSQPGRVGSRIPHHMCLLE